MNTTGAISLPDRARIQTGEKSWSPFSWKTKPNAQEIAYADHAAVERVVARIRDLPPLVNAWEVERLRSHIAAAQLGRQFLLQGGDCAETMSDCRADTIFSKLGILLKMSLVLSLGGDKPVVRVGRLAGQYAKPRSSMTEVQGGVELPSYFGDLINRPEFTEEARRPDPELMIACYQHAAMTLNFARSWSADGLGDLHDPKAWDLSFSARPEISAALRDSFAALTNALADALRSRSALSELSGSAFFTSHEGLNLHYESAQTHAAQPHDAHYDLTTHMPWIGERTRALDGAHVEYFRGIRNPIGIKLGPSAAPAEVLRLLDILNPHEEPGRIALITRMGGAKAASVLPPLLDAVRRADRRVLWVCDPMHGNTVSTRAGVKTRNFDSILREIEATFAAHEACGTFLGGIHIELTGEDVTECVGAGVREEDLPLAYKTRCDPRLNQAQALELAYRVALHMRG